MKKIALSVVAIVGMSSFGFAGGDIEAVGAMPVAEGHNGFYAGLGVTAASVRDSDFSVDWGTHSADQERIWNVSFIAGYDFNEYVAAEGRFMTSFAHENSMEMSGWSLFVKPQYPVSEDFSIYALLGYGGITGDGINGIVTDIDDTGFQWGLGASYMVTEDISLYADYVWAANDMDGLLFNGAEQIDVDTFTVGMNYKF